MSFQAMENSTRKSDFVAEQIIREIKSGNYEEGDKLPSESEIARQIGVSRNSVREAINALRIVGVVETKHGEGSFVKSSSKSQPLEDPLNNSLDLLKRNEHNPFDILEVRQKVEPALAKLAVNKVTDEEISLLSDRIDRMREVLNEGNPDKCFSAHWDFHTGVIGLTGNEFAIQLFRPIAEIMRAGHKKDLLWWRILRKYHTSQANCKGCLSEHEDILEALREGDEELLQEAYRNHFESVDERLSLGA